MEGELGALTTLASVNRDQIVSYVRVRVNWTSLMEPTSGPRSPYVQVSLVIENWSVYPITVTSLTGSARIYAYDAGPLSGHHEAIELNAQGSTTLTQDVSVRPGFFAELANHPQHQPGRLDFGMAYSLAFLTPFGAFTKNETQTGWAVAYQ
jgi:hypothetical protein